MKPFERHQEILDLLREQREVKVTELAAFFDVSEGTIRNDLDYLGETNQITRIRGGARLSNVHKIGHPGFAARARMQASNKLRIARWAADNVKDGEAIFLDASTTAFYISSFLSEHRNLTIITCGIETAQAVSQNPSFTVILLGGIVRADSVAVTGQLSEKALDGLHVRTAFVSCAGFSLKAGLSDSDIQLAHLKSKVIQSAEQTIALIESSKFGRVQVSSFAKVGQVAQILTDDDLDPNYIDELQQTKTVLTICGERTTRSYAPHGEQATHIKIGFANLGEDRPYAVDVRRGLEMASQEMGHIDLIRGDNQYDSQVALKVADRLITEGVDLAIEYHYDEATGALLVDKFSQAGIPVIAVDTPMVGATFFGVDNYRSGWDGGIALGKWVQKEWQGEIDRLIVLEHSAGGPLPVMRITGQVEGFRETIGEIGPETILRVDDASSTGETEQQMLKILESLPDARRLAVISLSDSTAEAVISAAQRAQREHHVVCVAQGGGTRLIRAELRRPGSSVVAAALFRPEEYGVRLIELARRVINREQVPPAVYIRHVIVDGDTVGDYYWGD